MGFFFGRTLALATKTNTEHEKNDQALFERIAHEYCRKDLLAASRAARKCRLEQTMRVIQPQPHWRYLEVGCGAGFSAEYLAGHYGEFCGVDYSDNLISFAQRQHNRPNVQFVASNIKDYQPELRFDVVFAIGLLHHLDDVGEGLGHMFDLLKPNGWLIANEPQPANPAISWARQIRKRVDANYSADQTELTGTELRQAFEEAGLHSIQVVPQGLLSTPFAEVALSPQWLLSPISNMACMADKVLERVSGKALSPLTWNVIVAGQKPQQGAS